MSLLSQDLRYAARTLGRSPGFAAIAVLTLALGIGANTAIFSFVDGILLKPLPYPDADRIVRVLEKPPGFPRNGISTLNFLDWQKQNTVFDFMAAQTGASMTLSGTNEPVLLHVGRVSPHYFEIFGIKAVFGRTFLPDEDQLGKDRVVLLSYILWQNRFGGDRSILNRTILLDNQPYQVVGILPAGSAFDRAFNQLWRPLAFEPANMTRNFHWMGSFGRLKQGVSLQQAQKSMDVIGARIAHDYPDSNKGWGVVVEKFSDVIVGPEMRTALYVLMSATIMVLLISCANLANLALARGVAREREVSIRASLGASRWRLIRQFLTENVLIALCGGVLGIGIGYVTMRYLNTLVPPNTLPREVQVGMDGRVLLFALAISVLTGLVFGMAPALQATTPDLANSMKEGGRGSTAGAARRRLRDVLVVAEVSVAFVLLVGSGLMMQSFFHLVSVDPGFDSTNILTMSLPTSDKQYPDPRTAQQLPARAPWQRGSHSRGARDGIYVRAAAAGILLRNADAAGEPADGGSGQPPRRLFQDCEPIVLPHSENQAAEGARSHRSRHQGSAAGIGDQRAVGTAVFPEARSGRAADSNPGDHSGKDATRFRDCLGSSWSRCRRKGEWAAG